MLKSGFAARTGFLVLLRIANAGLNVLILVVLARAIGSEGVGIYSYVVVVITIVLIPLNNGAHTLVLKLAAEATAHGNWAQLKGASILCFLFAAVFAALAGIGLAAFQFASHLLPAIIGTGMILVLALILLFDGTSAVRSGIMRGLDFPLLGQMPELIIRPGVLLLCLLLLDFMLSSGLQTGPALYALLAASIAAAGAGLLIALKYRPTGIGNAPAEYRREWLSSAASFASKGGIAVLNNYVDILLLGILLASSAEVGIYRVAAQIAVVSGIVYVSINALATQTFALQLAKDDISIVAKTATHSARLAFAASLVLPIVMLFSGGPLMERIFGPDFARAAPIALVLLIGQMVNSGFGTAASLLTVSDRGWTVTRWFAYGTAVNIALCMLLIPALGMMGAAVASLLSGLLFNLALWSVAKREIGVDTSILGSHAFGRKSGG